MKLSLTDNESDPLSPDVAKGMVRGADGKLYPKGSDPRARKVMRRRWKWAVAGIVVLLVIGLIPLSGWYMLGSTPARYTAYRQQLRQSDPRELKQAAADIEAAVLGDLLTSDVAVTPGLTEGSDATPTVQIINGIKVENLGKDKLGRDLRRVELNPAQVNAWLAASFSDWLEYRDFDMPSEVRSPMMDVVNGKTTMFFTFESETFSQVFEAEFDMTLDDGGMATIKLEHMKAGRVPVPVAAVGDLVSKAAGQAGTAQRASQWISKIQNYRFKPAVKLPDGLKANIVSFKSAGDKVTLTLAIERYRASSKVIKNSKIAVVTQTVASDE